MKIILIDTVYPDFLTSLPFDPSSTYEAELRKVLDCKFGTFDAYSRNLRQLGWTAIDLIMNHERLQEMWLRDHDFGRGDTLGAQLSFYEADVVFLQDVSIPLPYKPSGMVAAQCSCPWPGDANIRKCDVVFTSFPHYIPRIEALGVRAVYLPLAFEPSVLQGPQPERDIDISFVGGVGRDLHWRNGTDVLEAVAAAFPDRFQWWGYGLDRLPALSPLRRCYRGEAWGRRMYEIYRRSKIVINRHGEVSEGFANNLRMYEATGCGAMLLTDGINDNFGGGEVVRYSNPNVAVGKLESYLQRDEDREGIAAAGQARTLRDHTYSQRMKVVSDVLTEMLCTA